MLNILKQMMQTMFIHHALPDPRCSRPPSSGWWVHQTHVTTQRAPPPATPGSAAVTLDWVR